MESRHERLRCDYPLDAAARFVLHPLARAHVRSVASYRQSLLTSTMLQRIASRKSTPVCRPALAY